MCVSVCFQLHIISRTCSIHTKPDRLGECLLCRGPCHGIDLAGRSRERLDSANRPSLSSRRVVVLWHQMKAGKPTADKVERG